MAAQITIKANANVVKALTFTSKQDLDFGTIMPAATGTTTVSMSMAGAISCPAGNLHRRTRPAIFNVQGPTRALSGSSLSRPTCKFGERQHDPLHAAAPTTSR